MNGVQIDASTQAAKQMLEDETTKEELELIYNAKANPHHPVKWQKVYDFYENAMRKAIRKSGILKVNFNKYSIKSAAYTIVCGAVIDYDVNNPLGTTPSDFIFERLLKGLSDDKDEINEQERALEAWVEQESRSSKKMKTPAEELKERNEMLHAYNNIHSFKDREFVQAVLWMEDDKLELGKPLSMIGRDPRNFNELCAIYRIGRERGKKIYLDFRRSIGES